LLIFLLLFHLENLPLWVCRWKMKNEKIRGKDFTAEWLAGDRFVDETLPTRELFHGKVCN
jgi:hypothetical protein